MKVLCAWCEKEWSQTLLGEVDLHDRPITSHGICGDHKIIVLKQIQPLRKRETPRLQRRRHARTTLRAAPWVLASRTTRMRTPTRRRLLTERLSSAQLQLPFGDS